MSLKRLIVAAREELGSRRGASARLARFGSRQDLAEQVLDDARWETLIAEIDATALGFIVVDVEQCSLEAVWVVPEWRRRGIASTLVRTAEARSAQRGGARLSAISAAGGRAEKSLFEALGYRGELIVMGKLNPEGGSRR